MPSRKEVYVAIDSERDYQDNKWRNAYDDSEWSAGDWLIFIERYLNKAKDTLGDEDATLDNIRKIAGLAVAAMEYKGAPMREVE